MFTPVMKVAEIHISSLPLLTPAQFYYFFALSQSYRDFIEINSFLTQAHYFLQATFLVSILIVRLLGGTRKKVIVIAYGEEEYHVQNIVRLTFAHSFVTTSIF